MANAKKLSRKELKQPDEFQAKGNQVVQHIVENRNRYLGILGAAIAIIFVVNLAIYFIDSRNAAISKDFNDAMDVYKAEVVDNAEEANPSADRPTFASQQDKYMAASEKFQTLVDTHGSTGYGTSARFFLANSLFNLKRYDKARQNYEQFMNDAGGEYEQFFFIARFNIAQCFEAENQPNQALKMYQELIDSHESIWNDQALYRIAMIHYEQGENDKAVESLLKLKDKYPESTLKASADKLLLVIRGPEKVEEKKEEGENAEAAE